jgi:hypothetical protein
MAEWKWEFPAMIPSFSKSTAMRAAVAAQKSDYRRRIFGGCRS